VIGEVNMFRLFEKVFFVFLLLLFAVALLPCAAWKTQRPGPLAAADPRPSYIDIGMR
jgi:hypothetical protein